MFLGDAIDRTKGISQSKVFAHVLMLEKAS
jgi:hypothetical protein